MALCPFARHRLITPGSNDPRIIPVGAVLHVDAGNAESLYDYFDGPSGGIESHFHVQLDGDIEQYRDTSYEADANYRGNSWTSGGRRYGLISIETQGREHGEWTPEQLASIKRLLRWLADTHNFPLHKAPTWQGPGVGYHVMWGAPGPWTPVAKTCPGPHRIKQFDGDIVAWMRSGGTNGGGSMSWSEDLSRGTPGTDITPLADDTLAKSAGRQAAELLGYAAASFYYVRRKLGSWAWLRDRLGRAVWFNRNDATGDTHSLIVRQTRDDTRQIRTRLAALTSLVEQLVERDSSNPLTAEQVRALFQEAVEDNLVRVEVWVSDAPDNGEGGVDDPDSSDS